MAATCAHSTTTASSTSRRTTAQQASSGASSKWNNSRTRACVSIGSASGIVSSPLSGNSATNTCARSANAGGSGSRWAAMRRAASPQNPYSCGNPVVAKRRRPCESRSTERSVFASADFHSGCRSTSCRRNRTRATRTRNTGSRIATPSPGISLDSSPFTLVGFAAAGGRCTRTQRMSSMSHATRSASGAAGLACSSR